MKYFLLLFTLVMLAISANCQLDKKYWLFGGSGNFFSYNDDFTTTGQPTVSAKLTEINLSANVGYFIFDKFAVGLRPGMKSLKSRGLNTASVGHKEIALYIGPFARYYFLNSEKPFNILLDGSYQIGSYSTFIGKGSFKSANVMAGPEIFFNTAVGMEFLVGYMHQSMSITESQSGFVHKKDGVFMSIGFQFHLIKD
ncbi:MAG TPA: hypothetical protein PLR98_13355 [Chitinophagaceae bacterium]|nr:hypothetical protein [Chitinophagaceae bacterium]